jgi:hypothetical protein
MKSTNGNPLPRAIKRHKQETREIDGRNDVGWQRAHAKSDCGGGGVRFATSNLLLFRAGAGRSDGRACSPGRIVAAIVLRNLRRPSPARNDGQPPGRARRQPATLAETSQFRIPLSQTKHGESFEREMGRTTTTTRVPFGVGAGRHWPATAACAG